VTGRGLAGLKLGLRGSTDKDNEVQLGARFIHNGSQGWVARSRSLAVIKGRKVHIKDDTITGAHDIL
jgi:hypothetical protein